MKIVPMSFSLFFVAVSSFAALAADISGTFSGMITPSGCRSSAQSQFSSTIADGRVKGVGVPGQNDTCCTGTGEFPLLSKTEQRRSGLMLRLVLIQPHHEK